MRHDYDTRVLTRTWNLAAVMKPMGHRDVKIAMHYQHPELDVVRPALDSCADVTGGEIKVEEGKRYDTFSVTMPEGLIANTGRRRYISHVYLP